MGAAEEVEADEDLVMAFEGDELAFETGQGTLDDTDGVALRNNDCSKAPTTRPPIASNKGTSKANSSIKPKNYNQKLSLAKIT